MLSRRGSVTQTLLIVTGVLMLVLLYSLLVMVDKKQAAEDMASGSSNQDLQVLHTVVPFSLVDSNGETFSEERVNTRFWIADFMFTSCPVQCKEMSANMSALHKRMVDQPEVHFVSISVDPITDTPERLREYGASYDADTNRWHFLTGEIDKIQKFSVEGLRIGTHDDPNLHSDRFVLVDHHMQIRGYYSGVDTNDLVQLEQDLRKLIAEHDHD